MVHSLPVRENTTKDVTEASEVSCFPASMPDELHEDITLISAALRLQGEAQKSQGDQTEDIST